MSSVDGRSGAPRDVSRTRAFAADPYRTSSTVTSVIVTPGNASDSADVIQALVQIRFSADLVERRARCLLEHVIGGR
jgi:hypothetical protein